MRFSSLYNFVIFLLIIYYIIDFVVKKDPFELANVRKPDLNPELYDESNPRRPPLGLPEFEIKINNPNLSKKNSSSSGTAFAVDTNGHWITARHVIEDCKKLFIATKDNRLFSNKKILLKLGDKTIPAVEAKVKSVHSMADLALLKTETEMKNSLKISRLEGNYDIGFSTGFPGGKEGEIMASYLGFVSAKIPFGQSNIKQNVIAWSIRETNPTNIAMQGISGGPMLNKKGQVVGVNIASSTNSARRGRIFTSDNTTLNSYLIENNIANNFTKFTFSESFNEKNFNENSKKLRDEYFVARVACFY